MKRLWSAIVLAFVGIGTANANWYTGKIDRMQLTPAGALIVYVSASAPHECGSYQIIFSDPTQPGFKYIVAALLSYEAQKDSVQFLITSCSGNAGIFQNIEGSPGV
jgi:hypothetical protein